MEKVFVSQGCVTVPDFGGNTAAISDVATLQKFINI